MFAAIRLRLVFREPIKLPGALVSHIAIRQWHSVRVGDPEVTAGRAINGPAARVVAESCHLSVQSTAADQARLRSVSVVG